MSSYTNVKIITTGKYIPSKVVTNKDLEKIVTTTDEWIISRTGIKTRHIVEGEKNSDIATQAAINAIEKVNYDKTKIDLIIVATFTPDYLSPSVANLVQAKLGLNNNDITCFDINAACTGFIYALNVATRMLNSGAYHCALVIGSEVLSKVTDYTDRNTCVLFGDGAGAIILENTTENKLAYFYTASQGDLEETIVVPKYISMNGRRVYQFAINVMEKSINNVLTNCKLSIDDIDIIIPHQANLRIIESVAENMKIESAKMMVNIDKYGNTSSASIIIALDEYLSQYNQGDQFILLVGFGGGFTWGAALLTT